MHVLLWIDKVNAPHIRTAPLAGNLMLWKILHSVSRSSDRAAAQRHPRFQTSSATHVADQRRAGLIMRAIGCVSIQRRPLPPACILPARLLPSVGQHFPVPLATANRVPIAAKRSYLGSWAAKNARFAPCLNLSVPHQSLVDRCWQA